MPYIVVNREAVLSRASPDAVLTWIDLGVSRATDYRYAITFDTFQGASKCARMQGGDVLHIGEYNKALTYVAWRNDFARGMGDCGIDSGVVEVE